MLCSAAAIITAFAVLNIDFREEKQMDLIKELTEQQLKSDIPEFGIGYTIRVFFKVKEGSRERLQSFEGVVIAKKHGGIQETVTVRRVSYGVGVEKSFPLNSPLVDKIEIVRKGKVRRAKLYYLRDKIGRSARIKQVI